MLSLTFEPLHIFDVLPLRYMRTKVHGVQRSVILTRLGTKNDTKSHLFDVHSFHKKTVNRSNSEADTLSSRYRFAT